ncbi:MAG: DUF2867 domain-containing protein [Rikenellaceae bacterium]|nr:DUF2867 domain-containing protein [Rikenellaceae bacterium]
MNRFGQHLYPQPYPDYIYLFVRIEACIKTLFNIRNTLVKPFGIRTENNFDPKAVENCIRHGEACGLFSVTGKSPCETVLCLDDKHLTAFISVYMEILTIISMYG